MQCALDACLRKGTLSKERFEALVAIPGMEERLGVPEQPPEDWWEQRCNELQLWVKEHNDTLPKVSSNESHEKALGNWLFKMKQLYEKKELSNHQLRQLWQIPNVPQRLAPSKSSTTFEDGCDRIQVWVKTHKGELPRAYGIREYEPYYKYLSNWLLRAIERHVEGRLEPSQSERLLKLHGVAQRVEARKEIHKHLYQQICPMDVAWYSPNSVSFRGPGGMLRV